MVGERGISKDYRSEKKDYQYWKNTTPSKKLLVISQSREEE